MDKIVPHLWFDTQAKEAVAFYVAAFKKFGESHIISSVILRDTPSGDAESIAFQLAGHSFMAISGGPFFKVDPSISFIINFDPSQDKQAREHLDELWKTLSDGGSALMPLGEYPFSKHYGWIQDKFGVSWQLMLTNPDGEKRPFICPALMFTRDVCGKAEEATDFYLSVFKNTRRGTLARYPDGAEPDKPGTVMFTDFQLEGQWFTAMDSAREHTFGFSEAISLLVRCKDQAEVDEYWEKLSAVPEAEQCGWAKDKYGLSWQIAPAVLDDMMRDGTPEQVDRVVKVLMPMKKLDLAAIEAAYKG